MTTAENSPDPARPRTGGSGPGRTVATMIPVEVTVRLGMKEMTVSDILNLGRGSVVDFPTRVGERADLLINNQLIARGEIQITEDGRLAIAITEISAET